MLLVAQRLALQMLYEDAARYIATLPYTPEQRVQVAQTVKKMFSVRFVN